MNVRLQEKMDKFREMWSQVQFHHQPDSSAEDRERTNERQRQANVQMHQEFYRDFSEEEIEEIQEHLD